MEKVPRKSKGKVEENLDKMMNMKQIMICLEGCEASLTHEEYEELIKKNKNASPRKTQQAEWKMKERGIM